MATHQFSETDPGIVTRLVVAGILHLRMIPAVGQLRYS
jgi:hypothetical protein